MSMEVLFIKFKAVTPIFWISIALVMLFIIWGAFFHTNVDNVLSVINVYISNNFGWFYVLVTTCFVILALFLIFGPYGIMKLGKPDEEPEYTDFTWLAFLITVGMGVALVLYGATEPSSHLYAPSTLEPTTQAAKQESLLNTTFHWGLHPWPTYAFVASALPYFEFRH